MYHIYNNVNNCKSRLEEMRQIKGMERVMVINMYNRKGGFKYGENKKLV